MSAKHKQGSLISQLVTVLVRMAMYFIAAVEVPDVDPPTDLQGGFVIVANHRSLLDLAIGFIAFRRWVINPFVFIREDYFKIPIFGRVLTAVGGIPTGPENGVAAMRSGLRVLQKGGALVIMPEGRIQGPDTPRSEVGKFRPGAARMALRSRNPVLVVAIMNSDVAWPLGKRIPRFHVLPSRRPRIRMAVGWMRIAEGMPNGSILAGMTETMQSLLGRLDDALVQPLQ